MKDREAWCSADHGAQRVRYDLVIQQQQQQQQKSPPQKPLELIDEYCK